MSRICACLLGLWVVVCAFNAAAQTPPDDKVLDHKVLSIDGPKDARSIFARIPERLSEQVVGELAAQIAADIPSGEKVASISFFLPETDLGSQPWAITRFDHVPPVISVLGLRAEDEAAFRAQAQKDPRDVIGVWLTSPPALAGKLTLLRTKDGMVAEWLLRSGQMTYDKLTVVRTSRGTRYNVIGGDGAYYLAARDGTLLLGDATRVIAVAEKLPVDPNARIVINQDAKSGSSPSLPAFAGAEEVSQKVEVIPAAKSPRTRTSRSASSRGTKRVTKRTSSGFVADLMGGAHTP